jgi:hypothetical protein
MKPEPITRRTLLRTEAAALAAASLAPASPVAGAESPRTSPMPCGLIGGTAVSRLILGSNPMGGGAHSRDLIYVGRLMKEYNTEERLFNLFRKAEAEGVNTVLHGSSALIRKYNQQYGGRLRQILMVSLPREGGVKRAEIRAIIDKAMAVNPAALYVFGDTGDYLARNDRLDIAAAALDAAAEVGVPLGIGGHSLEVVVKCEQQRLKPAFYCKTFHHDRYWSATPKAGREPFCWYDGKGGNSYSGLTGDHNRFHDNIWCLEPEETIRVMSKVKAPWIAFKVLAAGAIHPSDGFDYAFRNGADFIAVGMFDFQVAENAAIARECLGRLGNRPRPLL